MKRTLALLTYYVIPYADFEVLGAIPGLQRLPYVPAFSLWELTWWQRAKWLALALVPVVDGELLQAFGVYPEYLGGGRA